MRIYITLLLLLAHTIALFSGNAPAAKMVKYPGGKCYMYRITLADKRGTPYSLSRPHEFLSQKAIDRRLRQSLSVDSTDLPLSPAYLREIEAAGVEIVSRSKWNNTVLVRGRKPEKLRALSHLRFVRGAKCVWTSPDSIDSSSKRVRWHSGFSRWDTLQASPYGATEEQVSMHGGVRLHQAGFRGRGMTIAVLDGGFMNVDVIPAMRKIKILGTADFVYPPSDNIFKELDHGTMVLSVMAVNEPDVFIGSAPEASYWLLRCEDAYTESLAEEDYWAAAVEFADSAGVDVINSSLGYHDFDDKSSNYKYSALNGRTAMISRTASMLAGKGIVLVSSVGNEGMGTWKKMNVPADAHDIITVGAVSADRENAAFSGIGPTADGRIKPDVMATGSPASVINGRGAVSKDVGTSFSTPIVAGLVACLWQAFPGKTALEIIDMVRRCGDNRKTPDNIYGYGIPDFWQAYKDNK